MKILLISDEEADLLWDRYSPDRLQGVEMILSCGDLDPDYLTFLATMFHGPVVYVHGNHDGRYEHRPPEGCICSDGKLVVCKGLRILGLGGCMQYSRGAHQYTEGEMARRVFQLKPQIWLNRGFDILLTHAPAKDVGDGTDQAHQGFSTFCNLMDQYHPKLMAHGHLHQRYEPSFQRERQYGSTRVINGCDHVIVEL
jgi:Icc-related predicted phosphoesterase